MKNKTPKLSEIKSTHVIKLRGYGNCIVELDESENIYKVKRKSGFNSTFYVASLSNTNYDCDLNCYNRNLPDFDIMAIKKFPSSTEAFLSVYHEDKITNWDWVREEPTEKELEYKAMQDKMDRLQDEVRKLGEEMSNFSLKYL